MPYKITKSGGRYVVSKRSGGKKLGTHSSRRAAQRQIAAIHANEKKGKK